MKKIQTLKKEKEILAMNYEQEEEYLTNDLSKKLLQVNRLFPVDTTRIVNNLSCDRNRLDHSTLVGLYGYGTTFRPATYNQAFSQRIFYQSAGQSYK